MQRPWCRCSSRCCTCAPSMPRRSRCSAPASSAPTPVCLGHEATHVGIGASMKPEDVFAPSYREYGAQFMRGVKPREVLMYWGGDERGNDFSGPKHDYPWCVPIATQCLHAAGAALAFKLRGENARGGDRAAATAASSKTDFYAAINSAGAYKLPFVQCIINNGWAISVPRNAQTGAQDARAEGHRRRPAMPAGRRQRSDRRARGDAPRHERARTRRRRQRHRVHDLSPARPHHRRRRAPLSRRSRGQGRVDARADPAPAHLPHRRERLERSAGRRRGSRSAPSSSTSEINAYLETKVQPVEAMFDFLYGDLPPDLLAQRAAAVALEGKAHG